MALGIPYARPIGLEEVGSRTGYAGASDLFPIESLMECPRAPGRTPLVGLPPGWRTVFVSLTEDEVANLAAASPSVASPVIERSPALSRLAAATEECRAVYVAYEFWPPSYESVRPQLRAMYDRGRASGVGRLLREGLLYAKDRSRFNVAMHVRVGDLTPTPIEYFHKALASVLRVLIVDVGGIPVDVWIFSSPPLPPAEFVGVIADAGGDVLLHTHAETGAVSVLGSMTHFIESDVFLGSDSSMSWLPGWITNSSVALFAPNWRGSGIQTGSAIMEGNVAMSANGSFGDVQPLRRASEAWKKAWVARNSSTPG